MNDRQIELIDLKNNAKNGYEIYKKHFIELENIYLGNMNEDLKKYLAERGKSSLYFNKAQAKSRRISDQINKSYFSNDSFASLDSVDDEYIEYAQKLEKASRFYLREAGIFNALQRGIYELPYLGTIASRSYWNNGLVVEGVSIHDLYFDPDANGFNDTRYIVNRINLAIEDVIRLQKEGIFNKDFNIMEYVSEDEAKGYTRLEVFEIYTRDDNNSWSVSTVYDDSYFFREDVALNDGLPFNWGGCITQTKKTSENTFIANYYEPVIASIKTLQEEYNARRNQVIDGIKQQLNPKKIVPKNSGINPIEIESPTGVVSATNPASITLVPPADIRSAIGDVAIIDQDMSELSGVSPMMTGVSNDKNKTATEKGIEHSEGSLKLEIYIRNLNETFFEPLLKRLISLIYKHGDSKFFMGIDRGVGLPNMNITFDAGLGVTNDIVRTQQISQSIQNMNNLFQMAMAVQDTEEAKTIYNATRKLTRQLMPLGGIKNVDDYLPEEERELGNGKFNDNGLSRITEQQMLETDQESLSGNEGTMQSNINGFQQ